MMRIQYTGYVDRECK